jgi:hypothetical protein
MSAMKKEYSRAYLQYLPEKKKQETLQSIIHHILPSVLREASASKTTYFYNMTFPAHPTEPVISIVEYIAAFKGVFTDCDVSYTEEWVDRAEYFSVGESMKLPNGANSHPDAARILQKGITIDWS